MVIPLFNKAPYVLRAIASVLNQELAATEIIVVDDGSTDNGPELVRCLALPHLKLLTQTNAGVSVARNTGIDAASCHFVAFLDADDCYKPQFLQTLARLVQQHPQAIMYCTSYASVGRSGNEANVLHPWLRSGYEGIISDFYSAWCKRSFTNTSSIAVRRKVLRLYAPAFPPGERLGEDQDLWFRLAEGGDIAYANTALTKYYLHVAGSATATNPVTDILPCYRRLGARLAAGAVPSRLRKGAKKLLASHLLNTARLCANAGAFSKASTLLVDRRAFGNPVYWARTALWLAARRLFGASSR